MSLLLAALKKSAENGSKTGALAELQLEEIQAPPGAQSEPAHSALTLAGPSETSSARSDIFSAKKVPPKKRLQLGIVPVAFIGGAVFALAGSFYVYHQISPPRVAPPIALPPPVIAAPALIALAPPPEVMHPVAAPQEQSISSHATKPDTTTPNILHQPELASIDPMLTSAYQAYQQGDFATAGQFYRDALAQDPMNHDALLGLAAIAQQQAQDDIALHYYRRVLALDPHDPIAQAALTSLSSGDAASKESRLNQLIAQQPDSAELHFALGNQYADQSRWAEAQQAYFNALAAEPNNALFAFNLAISLDHLGQRNTAAQYYRQALQLDTSGHSGFAREQVQQRLNHLTSH